MKIKNIQIRGHNITKPHGWDNTPTPNPTLLQRAASCLPLKIRKVPDGNVAPVRVALPVAPTDVAPGGALGFDANAAFLVAQQTATAFVEQMSPPAAVSTPPVIAAAAILSPPTHLGSLNVSIPPTYRPDTAEMVRLLRPPSQGSEDSSGASTATSSKTVMRTDLADVLGAVNVHITAGGENRLLQSVSPDKRTALAEVLDQVKTGTGITVLSRPSTHSPGMASMPVTVAGQARTAFIDFEENGRISSIDISHPNTLETELGAADAGKPPGQGPSTSTGSESGTTGAPPPALSPRPGVQARVDVAPQIRRIQLTEGHNAYEYHPVPDVNHGIRVKTNPAGELWLSQVSAQPQLTQSHGSGTDMMLGMARRLNEDGFGVRSIRAAWIDQAGEDGELRKFRQGVEQGQSPRDSALATFSGKIAAMFGFTDVDVQQTHHGDCNVYFRRPPDAGQC